MIVWLASYPRSGNTFLRMVLQRMFGVESFSLYPEAEDDQTSADNANAPIPEAQQLEKWRSKPEPCYVKTHDLPCDQSPAVCVVRDGRDSLVSYAHFLRNFEPNAVEGLQFDEVLEQLILGKLGYGDWSHHVTEWTRRDEHIVVLRYEELLARPMHSVSAAFRKLGIELRTRDRTFYSFEELHQSTPKFFRRGKSGSWQDEMSPQLAKLFWDMHGPTMEKAGYFETISAEYHKAA